MKEISPMMRWLIPIICLMIIWFTIIFLFYLKADEVTKDPCGICSKRMGSNVVCQQVNTSDWEIPATRVYYPNGSIVQPKIEFKEEPLPDLNFSNIKVVK